MANNITRYYPLFDEIKNHIFQWATENDFNKLPKPLIVELNNVEVETYVYYVIAYIRRRLP